MNETTLEKLGLVLVVKKLIIGKIGVSLRPESANVAIEGLDLIKELKGLTVFLFLCKG